VILGVVVEAISGLRYEDYVATRIFGPLGMNDSSAAHAPPGPGLAMGHRYLYGVAVPFVEPFPSGMVAAGYHTSTAEDMARFTAALSNGGIHEGADIVEVSEAGATARTYGTDWRPIPASAGTASSQSGATLAFNADIVTMPVERLGVVVLANANPTQALGLPAGAATIALDVLRLAQGQQTAAAPPTVRTVYLVIDVVLLVLGGAFLVHAARARTWRQRLDRTDRRMLFLARTFAADALAPLAVLGGLPLLIGATGSSAPGDVLGGWRFLVWTLPDIAAVLIALAVGAAALGVLKLLAVRGPTTARGGLVPRADHGQQRTPA
jgi:CubicO group peptidase (beta-lactamase class C family)